MLVQKVLSSTVAMLAKAERQYTWLHGTIAYPQITYWHLPA